MRRLGMRAMESAAVAPTLTLASATLVWALGALVHPVDSAAGSLRSTIWTAGTRRFSAQGLSWGRDPKPTYAGYLPVDESKGSALYYAYFEATQERFKKNQETPIVLWLQGGPGCASMVGCFYENGPWNINKNLRLEANPGAWNDRLGMLYIDQPIGTGLSVLGNDSIPTNLQQSTQQLYAGLQQFFRQHLDLTARPLFISGESYAGKYIPSLVNHIVKAAKPKAHALPPAPAPQLPQQQQQQQGAQWEQAQVVVTPVQQVAEKPVFRLRGCSIGNGLTDPRSQTTSLPKTALQAGLVTPAQAARIDDRVAEVLDLVDGERWQEAHARRTELLDFIVNCSGIGTMLDLRRYDGYDPQRLVNQYLNLAEVRSALGVHPDASPGDSHCSTDVRQAMSGDIMKSVKDLVPGILEVLPVLLYQGQADVQDGPASNAAWINSLDWPHREELAAQEGQLWEVEGQEAGWWRKAGNLTHAVVRNAGHLVPHDQPLAARWLVQSWIDGVLGGGSSAAG